MQYALLIYHDEDAWENATEEEKQACYAEHGRLRAALDAKQAWLGGSQLHPTATATTVRVGAPQLLSDGPFAETTEALGGFYLIEAADLDEAVGYAKLLSEAAIEVRPVVERGGGG